MEHINLRPLFTRPRTSPVVGTNQSIADAVNVMTIHKVNHCLVDDAGVLVGIVTRSDIIKFALTGRQSLDQTCIESIMSTPLYWAVSNDTVEHTLQTMRDRSIRCLPVFDDGNALLGVTTMMELIAWYADEMECQVDDLVQYVGGRALRSPPSHGDHHIRRISGFYRIDSLAGETQPGVQHHKPDAASNQ